jgi:hypothetical protein
MVASVTTQDDITMYAVQIHSGSKQSSIVEQHSTRTFSHRDCAHSHRVPPRALGQELTQLKQYSWWNSTIKRAAHSAAHTIALPLMYQLFGLRRLG